MTEFTLLRPRPFFKPFQYPWAYDAFKKQNAAHWLPEEVEMASDISEWKGLGSGQDHTKESALTADERHLITQVLRFFVQSDLEVQNNYMTNLGQIFHTPEVAMMLSSFGNMEGIHVAAYSHLIDTLNLPEAEYSAFLSYKEMKDKADYLHQFNVDTPYNTAKTMAVFGAFMEGVQLFSSFAIFMNFPRRGLMKGLGKIIKFSIKDESLHSRSIAMLFKTFLAENADVIDINSLKNELAIICQEMIDLEDKFIDVCFGLGKIEGLSANEVKQYIRHVADLRLSDYGLDSIYGVTKNPLPWLDDLIATNEHALFFEQRVSEYSKGSSAIQGEIDFDKEIIING